MLVYSNDGRAESGIQKEDAPSLNGIVTIQRLVAGRGVSIVVSYYAMIDKAGIEGKSKSLRPLVPQATEHMKRKVRPSRSRSRLPPQTKPGRFAPSVSSERLCHILWKARLTTCPGIPGNLCCERKVRLREPSIEPTETMNRLRIRSKLFEHEPNIAQSGKTICAARSV
jgi:hypothetical protein